jgi:hypothetical protein
MHLFVAAQRCPETSSPNIAGFDFARFESQVPNIPLSRWSSTKARRAFEPLCGFSLRLWSLIHRSAGAGVNSNLAAGVSLAEGASSSDA